MFLYVLLVGTYCGDTVLSSISCSHYGFPRKLIKNNLFSARYYGTELFIFHQHYNTSAAFCKRTVSESSGSPTFFG